MSTDWKAVGQAIAEVGLPLLGGVVAGPAGASLGTMVASTIKGDPNNTEQMVQIIKTDPQAAVQLQQLQNNTQVELQKLYTQQALAQIQADTQSVSAVNETMRAEYQAQDNFRGRWRPMFGYEVGFTWTVQTLVLCFIMTYTIIKNPQQTGVVMIAIGDMLGPLSIMWGVALGVLGVAVKQRSNDKARAMGVAPTGLLDLFKKQSTS